MTNKELLKEAFRIMFEPGGFVFSASIAIVILILFKIIIILTK